MGLAQFSALILCRRKELKLTQEQVARKVGVHANYIGYLERGLRRPGDKTLVALCRALDVDKATVFATLNPLFRDLVRTDADGGSAPDEPPPLRALLEDEALVSNLGATRQELEKLRVLSIFGRIARKEDYARIYRTIQEITGH